MEQHRSTKERPFPSLLERIPTLWEAISRLPIRQGNANNLMERLSTLTTGYTPAPEQEAQETTYYELSGAQTTIFKCLTI
jgi:hypothetical protein